MKHSSNNPSTPPSPLTPLHLLSTPTSPFTWPPLTPLHLLSTPLSHSPQLMTNPQLPLSLSSLPVAKFPALYDVAFAYPTSYQRLPSFIDLLMGRRVELYFYMRLATVTLPKRKMYHLVKYLPFNH